ncbi:hypothetical protein ACLOJK_039084 [Asimina triloba]
MQHRAPNHVACAQDFGTPPEHQLWCSILFVTLLANPPLADIDGDDILRPSPPTRIISGSHHVVRVVADLLYLLQIQTTMNDNHDHSQPTFFLLNGSNKSADPAMATGNPKFEQ